MYCLGLVGWFCGLPNFLWHFKISNNNNNYYTYCQKICTYSELEVDQVVRHNSCLEHKLPGFNSWYEICIRVRDFFRVAKISRL